MTYIFQDEYDEIETAYGEEKRLLLELEERFEKLKEEYDKVLKTFLSLHTFYCMIYTISFHIRLWLNAKQKKNDWLWRKPYGSDVGEQLDIFNAFGLVTKFEKQVYIFIYLSFFQILHCSSI